MGQIAQITEQQFPAEVGRSPVPVLVDFHATWCVPCKALSPVLEEVARHYGARLKIVKMDVDEAQETAGRLGIMSVPTLILFKNGEESYRRMGGGNKNALVSELDKVL